MQRAAPRAVHARVQLDLIAPAGQSPVSDFILHRSVTFWGCPLNLLKTHRKSPDPIVLTYGMTHAMGVWHGAGGLGGVSCTAIILSSKISNSCRYFFEIRCVPIWVLGRAFFRFDSVILLLFINVVDYYIIYCQIINTAFIMVFIFDLEKECVLMYILK